MTDVPRYPTLHVDVPPDDVDEASAQLFDLGATGVEERDRSTLEKSPGDLVLLVAHFASEDEARIAGATLAWASRLEHVVGDEWKHRWREFFKPSRLGEHIVVRPPWEEVQTRPGDVVITIDPGQAFGTGTHETTRLVLAELDRIVKGGERVLDVGCGSGILSIGAVLLGAASAAGIDVERESVDATHENAERNGVGGRVKASLTPLARVKGAFPLVLANVESRVLVPFAKDIAARVAPGGTLVLSGLLADEEETLKAAYAPMETDRVTRERDWIAIVLKQPAAKKPAAKAKKAKKPAPKTKAKAKKPAARAKKTKKPAPKTKAKKPSARPRPKKKPARRRRA
ncbi:MAG: 50S ribosomal protein L11 methyltransferase [Sandaracinus sp.]